MNVFHGFFIILVLVSVKDVMAQTVAFEWRIEKNSALICEGNIVANSEIVKSKILNGWGRHSADLDLRTQCCMGLTRQDYRVYKDLLDFTVDFSQHHQGYDLPAPLETLFGDGKRTLKHYFKVTYVLRSCVKTLVTHSIWQICKANLSCCMAAYEVCTDNYLYGSAMAHELKIATPWQLPESVIVSRRLVSHESVHDGYRSVGLSKKKVDHGALILDFFLMSRISGDWVQKQMEHPGESQFTVIIPGLYEQALSARIAVQRQPDNPSVTGNDLTPTHFVIVKFTENEKITYHLRVLPQESAQVSVKVLGIAVSLNDFCCVLNIHNYGMTVN